MPRHLYSAHPLARRPARGARRTGLALWLALVAGQVLCSNARAAEPQPGGPAAARSSKPNIVLIIVCTFRYDHLGAAGYPRRTTPFLDSLAEKGAFFENVVAASTWTKPTVSSILTGLTPNVHGMNDYYVPGKNRPGSSKPQRRRVLADGVVTLAE